jgi:hypothetical protein
MSLPSQNIAVANEVDMTNITAVAVGIEMQDDNMMAPEAFTNEVIAV